MRKKIAIIGVVLLIVGVAFFAIATEGILSTTTASTQMLQQNTGEWASSEINISSGYQLTMITNNTSFGVVPASDLSSVTNSNLQSLGISPKSETNQTSLGVVSTFSPAAGSYYIIVFDKTMPSVTYTTATSLGSIVLYGILELVGIIVGIAGFIVLIVGLILKKKNTNPENQLM